MHCSLRTKAGFQVDTKLLSAGLIIKVQSSPQQRLNIGAVMYNLYILELVWSTHSHTIDLWYSIYIDIHLDTIKLNVYGKWVGKIYYTKSIRFSPMANCVSTLYQRIPALSRFCRWIKSTQGLEAGAAMVSWWRSWEDQKVVEGFFVGWLEGTCKVTPPKNNMTVKKKQAWMIRWWSMYFLWKWWFSIAILVYWRVMAIVLGVSVAVNT